MIDLLLSLIGATLIGALFGRVLAAVVPPKTQAEQGRARADAGIWKIHKPMRETWIERHGTTSGVQAQCRCDLCCSKAAHDYLNRKQA